MESIHMVELCCEVLGNLYIFDYVNAAILIAVQGGLPQAPKDLEIHHECLNNE